MRWLLGVSLGILVCVALVLVVFDWQAGRREVGVAFEIAPATGGIVEAADVAIFVQEMGPANGLAVLFVHGTGAWSETWRQSMTTLAQPGFRVIAIDLPPFGFSQRPATPRYGKLEQGKRIVGVLDALKIQRAILVGHSFGGGPTMEAAFIAPQRMRGLVLVDVALSINENGGDQPTTPLLLEKFLATPLLRDSVVATFLTNPLFTRRLLQLFIDNAAHATDDWVRIYREPLAVRDSTRAIGTWLPELLASSAASISENPAAYKALTMPVKIICGGRDTITPLAQGQLLARIAPGAELTVMPEVGHIPQIEDTKRFNDILLKLVSGFGTGP